MKAILLSPNGRAVFTASMSILAMMQEHHRESVFCWNGYGGAAAADHILPPLQSQFQALNARVEKANFQQ